MHSNLFLSLLYLIFAFLFPFLSNLLKCAKKKEILTSIFSAHNDDDEGLDGLELYKAIKHAKSHETPENGDDQTDEENVQSEFKITD